MAGKKTRPLPQDLSLPMGGADSHVHLDMGGLVRSLDLVLDRARACGISSLGNVFLGPDAYDRGKALFTDHDQVFFILGTHPHDALSFDHDIAQRMINAFKKDEKIKAMGEIGLDFYYDHSPRHIQIKTFEAQLETARQLDKPVVIHSRDAYLETIESLVRMGFSNRPVLWHCFGLGPDQARKIVSMGWHISIPGSVTYKKNDDLRRAVKTIDLDRLLMETDCPFLAPEPYRGKENEPSLLGFTALKIAEIKEMDPARIWLECGRNCREFFNV